jgi:hypothetical protein
MNTVFAADQFTAANSYTVTKTGSVAPMNAQNMSSMFRWDPGLQGRFLRPQRCPGTGMARFLRWHPWGLGIDSNAVSNCYLPNAAQAEAARAAASRTAANPQAGVWEVSVDARRNSDTAFTPYTLVRLPSWAHRFLPTRTCHHQHPGCAAARSYELTSVYAPFTGRGGWQRQPGQCQCGCVQHRNHETGSVLCDQCAPGSTSLRATIGSPSDPAADLDLFVYNCTTEPASWQVLMLMATRKSRSRSTTPLRATVGVLVDGYSVPAGTTTFNYVDVFINSDFGTISVTDADALRPTDASWTVPGTVTANTAPAPGRVLVGNVLVRTSDGLMVGSGDVIVQSVVSP